MDLNSSQVLRGLGAAMNRRLPKHQCNSRRNISNSNPNNMRYSNCCNMRTEESSGSIGNVCDGNSKNSTTYLDHLSESVLYSPLEPMHESLSVSIAGLK